MDISNTLLGQFVKDALHSTNNKLLGRKYAEQYKLGNPDSNRKLIGIIKELHQRDPLSAEQLLTLTRQTLDKNGNIASSTLTLRKDPDVDTSGMKLAKVTKLGYGATNLSYIPNEDALTPEQIEQLKAQLDKAAKKVKIPRAKGKKVGVATLADFHLGAQVQDLLKTPDFNIGILIQYLAEAAAKINSQQYKEVHIGLLGDFIESWTGLNHLNVWQEMGYMQWGANAVILATEVIRDHFLAKINNLHSVYIVSGNHDRGSANRELDPYGQVGRLLAYNLTRDLKKVKVHYHPLILTPQIDGLCYLLSHGHHRLTDNDMHKLCFEYGKQGMYNVLIKGHLHTRKTKTTRKTKAVKYNTFTGVQVDTATLRGINIAPLFTGNFYSESNGWTSTGGFLVLENNGKGRVNCFDYCF